MKRIVLLALPIALLAACSNKPTQPATDAAAASANALDTTLLHANHWQLIEATGADGKHIDALFVRANAPITLDIDEGRLSIANACNGMGGGYALEGDTLTIAPLVATQMACPEPAVMALDHEVSRRLEGALKIQSLDAGTLTLTNAAGDVLRFSGKPTADGRFGGPGERVFLEVAAQTKPCSHPMIPNMQCLQVRELRYDDNGMQVDTPGAFQHFYDAIEGYTHEPGVRNVLRVNRYKLANPPADASANAYVLDMVVESAKE
ncbi:MAG: META and DUF4377 domain-containing protein [Thermomonas sp.]|uniref:DUF4377 domain-containing protein n=1 Tax=Thermomonas sp. TaxID=1971895 RepID=UPI0039E394D7